nr:hypothetical protein [Tanacetum cinerariifolium]
MDMTIDQQVVLDEALVPHASRLRIRKSNFRLKSDISSKESTLQLVYDVLRLTPFYKAFLITADVPEIYMQEFWATTTVHHHSIQFKMDNKKRIINVDKEIRRLTDVNINKLHQPWRSFTAIINKCLSGKSTGYDSLRLSQAQILWGLYHKKNVYFAYLLWEDFIYQVKHKDAKKSNEMYYPRFTKVIIHHFMTKDPSIPRRNKVNWHYVRDDQMFTTIKLVPRHQNTQQFGAAPPKTKASVRKTKSSSDTTITPPTAATGTRLSISAKGKQPAKASKAKSLTVLSEVAMTEAEQLKSDDQDDNDAQDDDNDQDNDNQDVDDHDEGDDDDDQDESNDDDQNSDEEGKEFIHPKLSIHDEEGTKDEESFDPIAKTLEKLDDEGNDEENIGLNVGKEEGQDKEDDEDELYRDVNINLEGRVVQMADVHATQDFKDTHVTLTPVNPDGQQQSSSMDVQDPTTMAPLTLSAPTLTPLTIAIISIVPQAPTPPTTASSTLLQDLPNFGSLFGFDHRLKTLEANLFEFVQTNPFAGAVSSIPGIVQRYMDQQMNEAVKIIKEQVKEQVKVQVSKILLKIKRTVNEQLEAEVLTRDVVMMLRTKIKNPPLDQTGGPRGKEKERSQSQQALEGRKRPGQLAGLHKGPSLNKRLQASLHRQRSQCRLLKIWKRPYIKSLKQVMLMINLLQKLLSILKWFQQQKKPPTPNREWNKTLQATHGSIQPWISELKKKVDSRSSFNELMATPVDFSAFLMNRLKVDTLTPELLAGPTYELMKGSCKSLVELEFFLEEVYKASTDQLWAYQSGLKNWCLAQCGVKNRIKVRKDDDKLYKFKEGDFKRLRIQDIEDILLLLVKGKLTNLTVEERFAFNVSFRMFTKSVVIQRHAEDLQLGVESYQKKLNLTRPDTHRSDMKRKEAYTAYSNSRGLIYQNKDKQNRLMLIDELHKFSDRMLNDVRTALDDRLKGIRIKYLPQTIWRKSDKEREAAMI